MAKTLAEQFQFDVREDVTRMSLESVAKSPSNPTPFNLALHLRSKAICYGAAALDFYLLGLQEEAKKTAIQLPEIALEFFFGDWRASFVSDSGVGAGHEALRRMVGGIGVFEECLLWGAVLGRWEFLRRMAEYPSADTAVDTGLDRVDLLVFLALSSLLLDNQSDLKKHLQCLTTKGGERGKLIATVIQSLSKRDETETSGALHKYLAYFKKREFPKRNIFKKVSVLGTFVWHYGQHAGMKLVIDPKFVDHIVRLD